MSTILPSSMGCWLGVFSLSTEQESINSHLFLSILGFAIRHQTCISTFTLRQLVEGKEEEDFMEEVSAQMLWKCSRGGQPDSRQGHKATAAAAGQESRVHARLQDKIGRLKSASPYLAYLFTEKQLDHQPRLNQNKCSSLSSIRISSLKKFWH